MEIFRLLGRISIDDTEAVSAINNTTRRARDASDEQSSAFEKIGKTAGSVAKGLGVAGASIGGAFILAVEGTREYRQEMGLLESSFATAGHSSESAKNAYSDLNAVLGDSGQAVETAQHLALVADNEEELKDMTDILTGVYSTFGQSLPLEGLAEAINHSSSLGEVQGNLADALEWSGISVDDFNEQLAECSSEEERQDLITKTLRDTYGKASKQYKETNADIMESRKAQERLTDAMAKIGEVGEPVMTAIKNAIASMAEKAVPKIESIIEKIQDMAKWFKENKSDIEMWAGVVAIAIATVGGFVLVLSWSSIMTKASTALNLVTVAVKALNVAMKANVIGLVVTAIIGLVSAFIYLWNNCDGFRQFWIDLWEVIMNYASIAWEGIKAVFAVIGEWFKEKFEQVSEAGKSAMTKVKQWFSDAWKGIEVVWNFVKPYFQTVWNNIKGIFQVVKSVLSGDFKGAWDAIKGIWNNTKSYFQGIWNGIKDIFGSVGSWFGEKFTSAMSKIKSAFSGWGSFFSGLWTQIKDKFSSIGSSVGSAMGDAVKSGMNGALSIVETAINKGIGLINSAITLANKLPTVNVGKLSKIKIPRLATGGVIEEPTTAIVGESGAEAIIPLEKNTGWIRQVAHQLNKESNKEEVVIRLNRMIDLFEQLLSKENKIYLDSGVLVGAMAGSIDAELGFIANRRNRRNT